MWAERNGRRHLYLSERVNGKPHKTYVGTGPLAEYLAYQLEVRKKGRADTRAALTFRRLEVEVAEAPLDALCAGLDLFAAASLLSAGFHRHDRGAWRKRRERNEEQAP